jgi:DNA polymerase III epsilon subunit family exonuclease
MREIIIDTETTGFDPLGGHRVVEIGAVELLDRSPTGRTFHRYLNPERDMPADAFALHGLTAAFLADKPLFAAIADEFLEFVGDAPHNAGFDIAFLNADVTAYPLFQQALAAVPATERYGPLVTDEGGRPVKRRYCLALYRDVADAAGIPRGVWNMHARHGGTTEAQQAGVALQDIAEHAQHSNLDTTRKHYIVPTIDTSRRVAKKRVEHRQQKRDKA